ncbi:MAG: TMEM175 family protein [Bacteroidota bacterium]
MPYLHSKSRLEAFSDAVFAFAATLLVVSLEVPDSFELLKQQLSGFVSFGITFFALVLIWKVHYNFFRRTEHIDNWIIAGNMVLLFVILYFVYPLKFLVNLTTNMRAMNFEDLATLFQMYGIGFSLVFSCVAFLYWWASRLHVDDVVYGELRFYFRHFSIFAIIGGLSVLMAMAQWGIWFGLPGFFYAMLGPICYYHGQRWGYDRPDLAN